MTWLENQGFKPRIRDDLVHVRFRNGLTSVRPYQVHQMRWSFNDNDDPWDVIAYRKAEDDG